MIYDITPFTCLDYQDQIACIVWIGGCNMRCKYCYNHYMINVKGKIGGDELRDFLYKRRGFLSAVVFSGGECTLDSSLIDYMQSAKNLGYKVKLDTNGSQPNVIKDILSRDLVDFVALDFKAPKECYEQITGTRCFDSFVASLDLLISSGAEFELRTTWHFDLLSIEQIIAMRDFARSRGYDGKYYLQKFLDADNPGNLSSAQRAVDLSRLDDGFVLRGF